MNAQPQSPEVSGPLPVAPRQRSRLLRTLAAVLLGIVLGSSGTLVIGVGLVKHWVRNQADWPHRAAVRTGRALSLDSRERAEVERIFEQRFAAINDIRRENYPRLQAELDLMQSQVAQTLPPEKSARWDAFFSRLRESFVLAPPPTKSDPVR
ncbi:MAG: hypothetical protein ACOYN0_11450 [Phycisphaerales bacterium]